MDQGWKLHREKGSGVALGILTWIVMHLGRTVTRLVLFPTIAYYFLFAGRARRASRNYLHMMGKTRWYDVFWHFYTFATVSVDRLFFLSGKFHQFDINWHGEQIFEEYLEQKQGCLLLVSHVGSYDVMRVEGATHRKLPIRILMDKSHNARAAELIDSLDAELAAGIIDANQSPQDLALQMEKALSDGDMVGIMADRLTEGEKATSCDFLGKPASFPRSPWVLATLLKVPIVLCFGLYTGGGKYSVYFEVLTDSMQCKRKDREQTIKRMIECYVGRLEHYVSREPYNWFNFYDFWTDESASNK